MAKVKICGLSRIEDIECVNAVRPEYVGFVFAPSRRQVTVEQAGVLASLLHPDIIPVGVFVDESIERILEIVEQGIIEAVQLHGHEDEAYVGHLRRRMNHVILKAVSVNDGEDLHGQTSADYLLVDHGSGGTGVPFDWSVLKGLHTAYFLAGGLSAYNIDDALGATSPFAVDVSSGVETNGVKDPEKIREFIRKVRQWN